jgi:hypothetical protein
LSLCLATAAFTLQTYTHVIPGMDEGAANSVARLILRPKDVANGSILGSLIRGDDAAENEEPADLVRFRRSAVLPVVAGAGFEPATSGL